MLTDTSTVTCWKISKPVQRLIAEMGESNQSWCQITITDKSTVVVLIKLHESLCDLISSGTLTTLWHVPPSEIWSSPWSWERIHIPWTRAEMWGAPATFSQVAVSQPGADLAEIKQDYKLVITSGIWSKKLTGWGLIRQGMCSMLLRCILPGILLELLLSQLKM